MLNIEANFIAFGVVTAEEKKIVLIVEDDDVQANGIEHG